MIKEVKELIDALKATSESQPKELENYMIESLITFNGDKCKILLEYINKLEKENKKLNEEIKHIKNDNMRLATSKNVRYTYGLR